VGGISRQLGCGWRTVSDANWPLLQAADKDPSRVESVTILGVIEHAWHHVSSKPVDEGGRGTKELTGMDDLSRDEHGNVRARLLDLVPGRSGQVYTTWLAEHGKAFRQLVEIARLNPFPGYKNAIDDQFEDARSVLDAFHVVKLATAVANEIRRRVQQEIHGDWGRKNDPPHRVRNILRAGIENRTERHQARPEAAWAADDRHVEVELGWRCAQQVRAGYRPVTHAAGKAIAEKIIATFAACPVPEVAPLSKTLTTGGRSSWPTTT
jgi:transposase